MLNRQLTGDSKPQNQADPIAVSWGNLGVAEGVCDLDVITWGEFKGRNVKPRKQKALLLNEKQGF